MCFVVFLKNLNIGAVSKLVSVLKFVAKAEDKEDVDKFCPKTKTKTRNTGSLWITLEHPGSNPKPSIWLTLGLKTNLRPSYV